MLHDAVTSRLNSIVRERHFFTVENEKRTLSLFCSFFTVKGTEYQEHVHDEQVIESQGN